MKRKAKTDKLLDPIPSGEMLAEEFLKPLDISINRLARDIDVPPDASTRSYMPSAPSLRILRSGSANIVMSLPELWLNYKLMTICVWRVRGVA